MELRGGLSPRVEALQAKEGWFDFVCTMSYTSSPMRLKELSVTTIKEAINMTMKKPMLVVFAISASLSLPASCLAADDIVVECEQFADRGGWSMDSQFIDEMGSSYLLAHGVGVPVRDAVTRIAISAPGEYSVFARTKNWTAP